MAAHAGLCLTWSQTPKTGFLVTRLNFIFQTDESGDLRRLTDYQNYSRLSESDTDNLILLCVLISPDELLNKCIFQDADLCQGCSNEFYELSAVSNRFVLTNSIMIGGQRKQIHKIMACTPAWLRDNWIEPMEYFKGRLQRLTGQGRRESSCVII